MRLDDLLAYSSPKIVVVKDWRLGMLYYSTLIGICCYIGYDMITNKNYLNKVPPVAGSIRNTVRFNKTTRGTPSYCTPGPFNPDGCLFWSAEKIAFPFAGELNTLFLTTRVSAYDTPIPPAGCSYTMPLNETCKTPTMGDSSLKKRTYFVANVEYITIQVDQYSVRATSTINVANAEYVTYSGQNMQGAVQKCGGGISTDIGKFDSSYRESNQYNSTLDVMRIVDLLYASSCANDFDLANISGAAGAKPNEPLRSSGLVISVPIAYTNDNSPPKQLIYKYLPAIVEGAEFKLTETVVNADGSLTYLVRNGIRIVFSQTGQIGIFSVMALILNLVAAAALFSVAGVVVDSLMVYFLPRKDVYYHAKYQEQAIEITDSAAVSPPPEAPKDVKKD
ncbi:hypothetical protein BC833DRAFT_588621 [Globomyces pollinis-pini]|nr:hypothetical protein BC833DRAFT_588621 [Globomyces pollinis-pini]